MASVRKAKTPVEKGLACLSSGATWWVAASAVGVSKGTLFRAKKAKLANRQVGKTGRPRLLSDAEEEELVTWVASYFHAEGQDPSKDELIDEVCFFAITTTH
jgi:hypothetical protein